MLKGTVSPGLCCLVGETPIHTPKCDLDQMTLIKFVWENVQE